jgi:hypothetical protein
MCEWEYIDAGVGTRAACEEHDARPEALARAELQNSLAREGLAWQNLV